MNYLSIYENIILKSINDNRTKYVGTYYENHHIIPKCIGKFNQTTLLTGREHFVCHWLLTKIFPNEDGLNYAFWSMCNGSGRKNIQEKKYKISSRTYDNARKKHSVLISKSNKGRKKSDETKRKISIGNKGRKRSNLVKKKMSDARNKFFESSDYKLIHTDETKIKISMKTRNTTIYIFKNIVTNEIFTGMMVEFYKKFNYCKVVTSNLVNKKTKILDRMWVIE